MKLDYIILIFFIEVNLNKIQNNLLKLENVNFTMKHTFRRFEDCFLETGLKSGILFFVGFWYNASDQLFSILNLGEYWFLFQLFIGIFTQKESDSEMPVGVFIRVSKR